MKKPIQARSSAIRPATPFRQFIQTAAIALAMACVPASTAALVHRYDFSSDASDSEGTADGKLGSGFDLSTLTKIGINSGSPYGDPSLNGHTTDFRIFTGALTSGQVTGAFSLGADATNSQITAADPETSASRLGLLGVTILLRRRRRRPFTGSDLFSRFFIFSPNFHRMRNPLLIAAFAVVVAGLSATAATLEHRYDFETDGQANDTVGSAHGTLGTGTISGGKLTTDGTTTGVALPASAVAGITGAFTIEAWFLAPAPAAAYSTLFAFHNGADNFLVGTPVRAADDNFDSSIHAKQAGAGVNSLLRGNPQDVWGWDPNQNPRQMLVTFDGTTLTYYQNGGVAPSANWLNGLGFNLQSIATQIGINRGSPFGDPTLNGSTFDFRIYRGALGPDQVADLFALGPNASNAGIGLLASTATLQHRYDFETDGQANDTVGSAHGTLGTGTISGGKLTTDGTTTGVTLPASAVSGITGAFTIETWFLAPAPAAAYSTLFAFHNGEDNFLVGTPVRAADDNFESSIHAKQAGAGVNSLLRGNPQDVWGGDPNQNPRQMLVTFDRGRLTYYQNGVVAPFANKLNGLGFNLQSIATQIGINRDSPFGDPTLNGSTFDFRIYRDALGPDQVADLFALGPNASNAAIVAATPKPDDLACLTNPIMYAADPAVTYSNGYFYLLQSTGVDVRIRRSATLQGLANAAQVIVFARNAEIKDSIWAPELHFLDGKWYIYSSGNVTTGGVDHRMFTLEANTADPMGSYTYKGLLGSTTPAIDESAFRYNGVNYLIWSQFDEEGQSTYIAPLTNPWTLGTPRVRISTPDQPWERIGGFVNEGPFAFQRDGRLFIVYSASGCWTDDYTLGLLEMTGTDLLNPASWDDSGPHFVKQAGAFGPGHNCVLQDAAGQWWNVYHANNLTGQGCGTTRNIRAQRLYWNSNGTPYFGTPVPLNSVLTEDPDFLVARFPLNETGGTTAKNRACGGDGALNGGAAWANPGLDFNGTDSFVLGDAALGNDVQFSLSLAAWVRPESFSDHAGIITKGTESSPWALQLAANGAVRFSANFGAPSGAVGGGVWDSTAHLTPGQWQHIAVSYDGTRLRFYINGVLDANSPVVNLRFGVSNEAIVLGADFPGVDEYFHGRMRDARIYGRALAAGEITTLASNNAPIISMVGNQALAVNTPTPALDFSIGDVETYAAALTLAGTSSNTTLVPNANIVFGGSGENHTVTITPAANQLGTATITLTVSDGALSAGDTFNITVTGTAMETWRFTHFGTTTNSGNSADLADPNNDGEMNLLEYATAQNPTGATRAGLTAVRTATALQLTYTRNKAAFTAGTGFTVEWSDNLATNNWSSSGVTQSILNDNGTLQTVKASVPCNSAIPHRFMRLKVTSSN